MPKERKKRLDWFKFFPMDFVHGTKTMTNEEVGAYIRLLCEAWLNMPEVGFRNDTRTILGALPLCSERRWTSIKEQVLSKFKLVTMMFKGFESEVFINQRLIEERNEALVISDNAIFAQSRKANGDANAVHFGPQEQERTGEDKRGEDRTQQRSSISSAVTAAMDELEQERVAAPNASGLKPGDPGYFKRGQYHGSRPKDVYNYCAAAWSAPNAKGEAAYCRYPVKHPSAKTDAWEDLCKKSPDLIVPAFELWIQAEGRFIHTSYPLSEFLKGSTPQDYMDKVLPMNAVKPKFTVDQIEATRLQAARAWEAGHGMKIGEQIVDTEPGPDALFGPEELKSE